ncbi:mitochondrial mRNA pseudouridine synthase Rpusd3-like [Octopus bimaculoides]|uniref:Pseudouridine synthase RsuA/RluA-like domain-containing protein n=1 Tax=Octopus bimaculoides TaxID=37653 RepID=A0A0L8HLN9_OCTBM|nr:mitochondrial mRNA pseudouridine synthase Rpusd3-like [Octopus bimaculoides]
MLPLVLNPRHLTKCGNHLLKALFPPPPHYPTKARFCNITQRRWIHTREIGACLSSSQDINIGANLYQTPDLACNSSYRYHSSFRSERKEDFSSLKMTRFMENILNHVIYEDDDVVAINKPSGVTVFGQKVREHEDEKGYCLPIFADSEPDPNLCLADIMPLLRRHFKSPALTIVHSIKMFYSGVLLLAKHKTGKDKMMQSLDRAKSLGTFYQSYLAITVGIPKQDAPTKSSYYLKQENIQDRVLSLPTEAASKNLRKSGKIQRIEVQTTILKKNEVLNCALVRLDTVKDKWQCLEVYCTTQLCHVLGDYLYSGRVGKVFGVPVLLEPHFANVGKQKLPEELKAAMKLKRTRPGQMPLYLHRAKVDLTQMKSSKPVLSIVAPFPDHFLETLQKLQLEYSFDDIFDTKTK